MRLPRTALFGSLNILMYLTSDEDHIEETDIWVNHLVFL